MAPKYYPTRLSGGDRKALAKELGKARARLTSWLPSRRRGGRRAKPSSSRPTNCLAKVGTSGCGQTAKRLFGIQGESRLQRWHFFLEGLRRVQRFSEDIDLSFDLADLGYGGDKNRVRSDRTQRSLREMIGVLNKVEPRFGSALLAYAWYGSEPLPGFSGQTAMQLVRSGRADEVLAYIDAVDAGVHA